MNFDTNRRNAANRLVVVKTIHTLAWAFFAACIFAIPIASWCGQHLTAAWLAAIVFVEVILLAFNKWKCSLTEVAARYTDNRESNFDIYLPRWLAKYNKQIFGPLYGISVVYAFLHWALTRN